MKKLLSFFSLLITFTVISLPLSAQGTITHTGKSSKTILVTFSVNMELVRLSGLFNPPSDTVSIGGNFNAWEKTNLTVSQSNPDIYEATISVTDSVQDTIRFNFVYSPDIWEVVGVREYVITQANYDSGLAVLDAIGFDSEPFSPPTRVEFRCNMTIEMRNGEFVRGEKVFVRGDFNGWSGNDYELKDVDGDSIYSRIFSNFKADQKLTFKFTHTHNGGDDVWEVTGNRGLTVSSTGPNIFTGIWEDACFCTHYKTIQVTFSINMELERLSGYFNPLTDTLSIRGSFNGWNKTFMTALPDSPDIYKVTTPAVVSLDEKISFAFFYSPGTWEINNFDFPNERFFIVTQEVFNSGSFTYDAIGFNVPDGDPPYFAQDPLIVFKCNTNGGKIINAPDGTEFKTIHIAGSNYPMQWPSSEWSDSDINKVMQLFDDGTHNDAIAGDKIFTNIVQFPMYSRRYITYRYGANWGFETNGGGNNNEFTSVSYHTLLMLFSKFNYEVDDTFGVVRYHDFTDVERIENTIPSSFKLEQNYPNPFNPETKISWQLAVGSFVTLKVYDMLGNEVAVLVNEEQPAGTYQVSFNTQQTTNNKQLSSGIYFYQLRAGDFVQTKKMILLR
ncbi:MAG: T9SS type A sorting domain-containing protein [Ignavibacteriaceae bacterium]|jgi:hypothetical protein